MGNTCHWHAPFLQAIPICESPEVSICCAAVETSDPLDILFELLPGVEKQIQDLRLTAIPGQATVTTSVYSEEA